MRSHRIPLTVLSALICLTAPYELVYAQPPVPPSWSLLEDADQDGIKDLDEILYGMNPLDSSDGLSDEDGDGLSLAWEYYLGTNPTQKDTDADGISDSDEVLIYGTNPLDGLSISSRQSTEQLLSPISATQVLTSSVTSLYPYITNGDFNVETSFAFRDSWEGPVDYKGGAFKAGRGSIDGWSAYFGSTMEAWQAEGKTFVELNGDENNYGVKQRIDNVKAGSYLLAWSQLARKNTKANRQKDFCRINNINPKNPSEVEFEILPPN